MTRYRLNGIAGHCFRKAICEGLKISSTEVHRTIKNISIGGIITTKEGKKYKLELKEVKDDNNNIK
jgi:hypothetical protein